jgi:hypothetical protein
MVSRQQCVKEAGVAGAHSPSVLFQSLDLRGVI